MSYIVTASFQGKSTNAVETLVYFVRIYGNKGHSLGFKEQYSHRDIDIDFLFLFPNPSIHELGNILKHICHIKQYCDKSLKSV